MRTFPNTFYYADSLTCDVSSQYNDMNDVGSPIK